MICSIHKNYGEAPETFEIVEPKPAVPIDKFVSYLKETLREHVEVTDIETASLKLPSEENEIPRTIDRIMVNIDTSLITQVTNYPKLICEAADALFMASTDVE